MKTIIVKLRDNTEIQIKKQYVWGSNIADELNDTRADFINIGEYIFAKDTIASVAVEEIEDNENESDNQKN